MNKKSWYLNIERPCDFPESVGLLLDTAYDLLEEAKCEAIYNHKEASTTFDYARRHIIAAQRVIDTLDNLDITKAAAAEIYMFGLQVEFAQVIFSALAAKKCELDRIKNTIELCKRFPPHGICDRCGGDGYIDEAGENGECLRPVCPDCWEEK